jgi:hypothetical protein
MADTLVTIKDIESENSELYKRQDTDKSILYLDKYSLKGISDQFKNKEVPGTVSVTMNKPAVYANAIVSLLQGAKRQVVVEGLATTKNHLIEQFLDDAQFTADMDLKNRHLGTLWSRSCSYVAIRGTIGARWTWDVEGKPHCLPIDMRWCPYNEELVAIHTYRTAAQIQNEYNNTKKPVKGIKTKDLPTSGKNISVYDVWKADINELYINETKVLELPNIYGFIPIAISVPMTGFMLMDTDHVAHDSESIFQFNRDLYSEWNRLMSIQQSMSMRAIKPPYVQEKLDVSGSQDERRTASPVRGERY